MILKISARIFFAIILGCQYSKSDHSKRSNSPQPIESNSPQPIETDYANISTIEGYNMRGERVTVDVCSGFCSSLVCNNGLNHLLVQWNKACVDSGFEVISDVRASCQLCSKFVDFKIPESEKIFCLDGKEYVSTELENKLKFDGGHFSWKIRKNKNDDKDRNYFGEYVCRSEDGNVKLSGFGLKFDQLTNDGLNGMVTDGGIRWKDEIYSVVE